MGRRVPEVEEELEQRIEALGLDLVEVTWAGSARRPILRIRVDVPGSSPGEGITVDECARTSRALEPWLDEHPEMPERYVLEVSSPGVERPLTRSRDYTRFAGQRVAVKGHGILADRATRLEGELLGLEEAGDGGEAVRIRLPDGAEVAIPRGEIAGAHLLFEWD